MEVGRFEYFGKSTDEYKLLKQHRKHIGLLTNLIVGNSSASVTVLL